MSPVSSQIVERFRSLSLERLARVEAAWLSLAQGTAGREAAAEIARVVHTVKGDARVVGFADVHLLCHKLEDLLAISAAGSDPVGEDLDLLVTMAIQFASLLLRKKAGTAGGGIDLPGFVAQVDEVVARARQKRLGKAFATRSADTRASLARVKAAAGIERLSAGAQHRLAAAATLVFLEHLKAHGDASARLLAAFRVLTSELTRLGQVPVGDLLKIHIVAAGDLAQRLGKQVRITEGGNDLASSASVPIEVAEALDTAVLHCLRNALDHGIEMPTERRVRGKPDAGRVSIDVCASPTSLKIDIADDGAGLDLAAIRRHAQARGLLTSELAARATQADLCELIFRPGFSTRADAGETSGRGVGLDAVRHQLSRIGGHISIEPRKEAGTRVRISLPIPQRRIEVSMFSVPGTEIAFAVDGTWSVQASRQRGSSPLDLAAAVGLAPAQSPRAGHPIRLVQRGAEPRTRWFWATGDPIAATAERIAVTAEDQAIEVVRIAGTYALMVRPDRVAGRV